ncbi:MAG: hypothetical protein HRU38_15065 [Saccharospirillaceae bacterium]|nr:hypothetical protein [Pseudomonadales bacterium]NRB79962.1 hypothetical protein [Saccharospirillaceae bacterium]
MKKLLFLACFFVTFNSFANSEIKTSTGQWVEWIVEAQASVSYHTNMLLSPYNKNQQQDNNAKLSVFLGRNYQVNGNTRLYLVSGFQTSKHNNIGYIEQNKWDINLGLRHKLGLGFNVPYVSASLKYGLGWYRSSNNPNYVNYDQNRFALSAQVGKHINERVSLATGFEFNVNQGESGASDYDLIDTDPFDEQYASVFVSGDYIVSAHWLVGSALTFRYGDFYASCNDSNQADVIATGDINAFVDSNWGCSYQVIAKVYTVSLIASYAINAHHALNFQVQYFNAVSNSLEHINASLQLSYNYSL